MVAVFFALQGKRRADAQAPEKGREDPSCACCSGATKQNHCQNRVILRSWEVAPERLVLRERIELSTSPLPMECSTTELPQQDRDMLAFRVDRRPGRRRAVPKRRPDATSPAPTQPVTHISLHMKMKGARHLHYQWSARARGGCPFQSGSSRRWSMRNSLPSPRRWAEKPRPNSGRKAMSRTLRPPA
jgi:hypothetical protein